MNLTKLFAASLCLTAMTASAVELKSDSFESESFSAGWAGPQPSDIVAGTNGVAEANSPINTSDTKVLKLDTGAGTWTNQVGYSFDNTNTPALYIDMLVKFVPSETPPPLGDGVKLAIAVTNDLLVVTKKVGDVNDWATTATTIDTSLWHRVTVKLEQDVNYSYYASVTLNGDQPVSVGGEERFEIVDSTYLGVLNSIGFQGTGFIDEVVVTTDNPLGGVTVYDITLSFAAGELSVLVSGTGTNAAPVVPSGTTLDVIAKPFYQIAGTTATNTWTSGGEPNTNGTITVTAEDDTEITFTAQPWTSTDPVGGTTSFANAPATNVAAWAIANEVTELTNEMYENYLLNIAEDATVPEMQIASISVSGTTVTVTITTTGNSVNFTQINGTLKLKLYETLGGTETKEVVESFDGTTTAEVVMDIGDAKFVKAVIE